MDVFDVHLISTNPANEIHQAKGGNDPVVLIFLPIGQLADAKEQLQEEVDKVQELSDTLLQFVIERGRVKQSSQLIDEECSGNVVPADIRHEEFVEFVDQLSFYLREASMLVILRNDHAIKDLDGVAPKLVMMAETKIEDLFHKGDESDLVALNERNSLP